MMNVDHMDQNELIEETDRCLTSLRDITETIRETLDSDDYDACLVTLIQRQEYVRQLVLLGTHPLLTDKGSEGRKTTVWPEQDPRIQSIKEHLKYITGVDKTYEAHLHSIKHTLEKRMKDMSRARRFIKDYRMAHPSESRFVDIRES